MIRIDALPDDVLLEIFDFHVGVRYGGKTGMEAWQSLVRVCRSWRSLVFGSPRRLNLRLYCTPKTPARDTLDVWPALPLLISGYMTSESSVTDNVIAALGQTDRVCQVVLFDLASWQLEKVLAAMQVSFPELTELQLFSNDKTPVVPDSILGGSAPRLRVLNLTSISFPGLPKLLLSAAHLVRLHLYGIPRSGYHDISPEVIVPPLSALSNLEAFSLEFQSPPSRTDWEIPSLPPPKRSILPALSRLYFKGVTEYLEALVSHIDTPQLDQVHISFFNQIDFDCPQLAQLINCTPTLRARDEAHVQFDDTTASIRLRYSTSKIRIVDLLIEVACGEPDWQLSSIEQVCSFLRPLSAVEDLHIDHRYSELVWKGDAIENTLWLELLLPFITVKNLYLSKDFAAGIASGLQELVGITTVLPSLQNIFVEELEPSGPFQENIGRFVAARQLSDHLIAISDWDKYSM